MDYIHSRPPESITKLDSNGEIAYASAPSSPIDSKPLSVLFTSSPVKRDTALEKSFEEHIRPLLNVVDRLRTLGIMEEGIQLPTIVVVGDQSSGKSSVLESLAGIPLPRGQGIATRVPLILRLEKSSNKVITIEYGVNKRDITEMDVLRCIEVATNDLAGEGKNIADKPITLHVKKPDAPDLTMVDLPGITRVAVHGQPVDIYKQISNIIRQYIQPEETIILNVLSAAVDFPTCESIHMSQQVDKDGLRTLAVVTKVDRAPEGLYEKVTIDAVNIGLGYICVRNRTDSEKSYEEARRKEQQLFNDHPVLSRLDKSMVGVPALANKLMQLQADSIKRSLPKIVERIDSSLVSKQQELDALYGQGAIDPETDGGVVFLGLVTTLRRTLEDLLTYGITESLPEDPSMHYTARLYELSMNFSATLHEAGARLLQPNLIQEIKVLIIESLGISLPNIVPPQILHHLLRKQVDLIGKSCHKFVFDAYALAEHVVSFFMEKHLGNFPILLSTYKTCAKSSLETSRVKTLHFVSRMLQKEKAMPFTCNPVYMDIVSRYHVLAQSRKNEESPKKDQSPTEEDIVSIYHVLAQSPKNEGSPKKDQSSKEEDCQVNLLMNWMDQSVNIEEAMKDHSIEHRTAWETKINLIAIWQVVKARLGDEIALEVRQSLQDFMVDELHKDIIAQVIRGKLDMKTLMKESPAVSYKRQRLEQSVNLLSNCATAVRQILGGGGQSSSTPCKVLLSKS